MKYSVIILTICIGLLTGCGEGFIVTPPPHIVITDSLILTIDSIVVSGLPYFADTLISSHYNFLGVDSVVMTFNVESTTDSNGARLVFSELDNFNNRLIPFLCGGIYGQCTGGLVTFNFNPIWNNFSLWFWFNVTPNSTFKFKDIRIYKAR